MTATVPAPMPAAVAQLRRLPHVRYRNPEWFSVHPQWLT